MYLFLASRTWFGLKIERWGGNRFQFIHFTINFIVINRNLDLIHVAAELKWTQIISAKPQVFTYVKEYLLK